MVTSINIDYEFLRVCVATKRYRRNQVSYCIFPFSLKANPKFQQRKNISRKGCFIQSYETITCVKKDDKNLN